MDGASIWAGDGVPLTSNALRVMARKLMADQANGGQGGEPVNKRARLESIIPTPVTAGKKEPAKSQPPPVPKALSAPGVLTPRTEGNILPGAAKRGQAAVTVVPAEAPTKAANPAVGAAGKREQLTDKFLPFSKECHGNRINKSKESILDKSFMQIPLLICDVKYLTYLVTRSFGNVSCKIFFSCKYIPLLRGNQ